MTAVVLPVGHYLGTNHVEDDDPPTHVIRIGWQLHELDTEEQFTVWAAAHGMPEGDRMTQWGLSDVLGATRAMGIAGAAGVLDGLMARDLVLAVEPDSPAAVRLAQDCRLRSLFRGIGRTEDGRQALGPAPGEAAVAVDAFTFDVWTWAPHCDSLWHLCEVFAAAGGDEPDALLADCLRSVQLLLAHGAAHLDEARTEIPDDRADSPDIETDRGADGPAGSTSALTRALT